MNYRVTDNRASLSSRIAAQQSRLNLLEEQLTTGKRINRPSDDPFGAEAVVNLRISQSEVEQFARSAGSTWQRLTMADDTLNSYEGILERVRTLITRGVSDTTPQQSKNALATELEAVRDQILKIANTKNGDDYLFGGTRLNAPPFDPVTAAAAATPAQPQFVQVEPGAGAIASGVTAETVFSDATATIFADLDNAIAALRGTGNEAADKATLQTTLSRLSVYSESAATARIKVGANMNSVEIAKDRLMADSASLDDRAAEIEGVDFVEAAVELSKAEKALEASLQVTARGRRSLFDFLG